MTPSGQRAVSGPLTVEITSRILTIDVGDCCQSQTQPVYAPHSTALPGSTSFTPSNSAGAVQSLPTAAIVTLAIGAAFLAFGATCFLFAYRRRAARRGRAAEMPPCPKGYQAVAAVRPGTPLSQSPFPSALTALSTRALLDLGLFREDDEECITLPPQSPVKTHHDGRAPTSHDRQSVDTIFALRFYYSLDLDRRSKGSFLGALPATPPRSPDRVPPSTSAAAPERAAAACPKRRSARKRRTYLNPAGEPWVSVPPPTAPLPPPPAPAKQPPPPPRQPRAPAPSSSSPQSRPQPRFSLFPPPPRTPPKANPPNSHAQHQSHDGQDRDRSPSPGPNRGQSQTQTQPQPQPQLHHHNPRAQRHRQTRRPAPIHVFHHHHHANSPMAALTVAFPPVPASAPVPRGSGSFWSGSSFGSGSGFVVSGGSGSGSTFREALSASTSPPPLPGQPGAGVPLGRGAGGRRSLPCRWW